MTEPKPDTLERAAFEGLVSGYRRAVLDANDGGVMRDRAEAGWSRREFDALVTAEGVLDCEGFEAEADVIRKIREAKGAVCPACGEPFNKLLLHLCR